MIIYKTTNTLNGKFYIGQDSNNDPHYLGSGRLLNKAIQKYGREHFVKEILEHCDTKEQLNDREKYWITTLHAKDHGYNIADGGTGGNTYTDETKQRISNLFKGRYVSPETIARMKQAHKDHPRKNTLSDETKRKIGKAQEGKTISAENKRKLSERMKTFTNYSSEWKLRQTEGKSGKDSPMWGKKHTEESRKKMSEAHLKNPTRYWLGKTQTPESNEKRRVTCSKLKHTEEHKQKIQGSGNPFYGRTHSDETKKKISDARKSKTPDQKLERYIKFYITRTGTEPTDEQKHAKYQEYISCTSMAQE